MTRRLVLAATVGLVFAALALIASFDGGRAAAAAAPSSSAGEPPTEGTVTPVDGEVAPEAPVVTLEGGLPAPAGPLIVVPAGCAQPAGAVAVFDGVVVSVSVDRARFRVDRLLAGSVADHEVGPGLVDVVYGEEVRFLEVDGRYIVGAGTDETELLVSTLRDPRPLFGGDAVIGLDDSDIDCPTLDDPVRTLLADGTPVDAGLLTPLDGSGGQLLRAVLVPFVAAFGILLALVIVKYLVFAFGRALRDA